MDRHERNEPLWSKAPDCFDRPVEVNVVDAIMAVAGAMESIAQQLFEIRRLMDKDEVARRDREYKQELDKKRARLVEQWRNNPAGPRDAHGWVYVIKCGDHYKIGMTRNLKSRTSCLGVLLPQKTELVISVESGDYSKTEAELHQKFNDRRVNGEWFALTDDDLDYICSMEGAIYHG